MSPARVVVLRRVVVALVLLAAAWGVVRAARENNDFDGFHRAAAQVWEHGTASTEKTVERYLPTFGVLLAPLGALPLAWAALVWMTLNVLALWRLPREFERLSGVPPDAQWPAWLVMLPFLLNNLGLGQSGPLLLWLVVAGVAAVRHGRGLLGGALIGVGALLKLLPAGVLAVPLLLGRVRAPTLGLVGAFWVGAWLMVLGLGAEPSWQAVDRWRTEVHAGQTPWALVQSGRSLRFNNQSVPITLARTFGALSDAERKQAPGSTELARIPLQTIWRIHAGIVAGFVALVVLAAWRARARARVGPASAALPEGPGGDAEGEVWLGLLGLVCILVLLVSPLVWTHYFVWALPALVAVRHCRRALLVGGLLSLLALASEPARGLGLHMALTLLLALCLAWRMLLGRMPQVGEPSAAAG